MFGKKTDVVDVKAMEERKEKIEKFKKFAMKAAIKIGTSAIGTMIGIWAYGELWKVTRPSHDEVADVAETPAAE